jgi:polyphosphate kinase
VPGLSENIRVRSIVGRYLEHSRIYRFANGNGVGEPLAYFGSADLMPRNLDRRIEALVPVVDPALQRRIDELLEVNLTDNTLAWTLDAEGTWTPPPAEGRTIDAHLTFQAAAVARSRRTDS